MGTNADAKKMAYQKISSPGCERDFQKLSSRKLFDFNIKKVKTKVLKASHMRIMII